MLRRSVACLLFVLVLAPAALADAGVRVAAPSLPDGEPPPTARACLLEFGGATEVTARCSRACLWESWDGPVLWIGNSCERTIWVSYLYEAADGRTYRTPCYELGPDASGAVPDPALSRLARRVALVAMEPGPGYPSPGLRPTCTSMRTAVEDPPAWLDQR